MRVLDVEVDVVDDVGDARVGADLFERISDRQFRAALTPRQEWHNRLHLN